MENQSKLRRYRRIIEQLGRLFIKTGDPIARMASAAALLHFKLEHFFWCGFYRLHDGDLTVGPYQGPLACPILARNQGVCWAGINRRQTIIVPDVHQFPGHIACDPRSKSEIVVPVPDRSDNIVAVLDVDSNRKKAFDETDARELAVIAALIYLDDSEKVKE